MKSKKTALALALLACSAVACSVATGAEDQEQAEGFPTEATASDTTASEAAASEGAASEAAPKVDRFSIPLGASDAAEQAARTAAEFSERDAEPEVVTTLTSRFSAEALETGRAMAAWREVFR